MISQKNVLKEESTLGEFKNIIFKMVTQAIINNRQQPTKPLLLKPKPEMDKKLEQLMSIAETGELP